MIRISKRLADLELIYSQEVDRLSQWQAKLKLPLPPWTDRAEGLKRLQKLQADLRTDNEAAFAAWFAWVDSEHAKGRKDEAG